MVDVNDMWDDDEDMERYSVQHSPKPRSTAKEMLSDNFMIRKGATYKEAYVYKSKGDRVERYRIGHVGHERMNLYAMSRKGEVWLSPSEMIELATLVRSWISEEVNQ